MMEQRKIVVLLLILGSMFLSVPASMAASRVLLNGTPMYFTVPPTQINGRTMVPLRGIFEALGAQVNWQESTRTITASKGDTEVLLIIGNRNATLNGQTVMLDAPAMILNGSTMVPLRFVSEALGAEVKWMEATQTVSITSDDLSTQPSTLPEPPSSMPYDSSYPLEDTTPAAFSASELDELLGPIALYPDPLIAQILPASTFPDQLIQADNLVQLRGGANVIDNQDWDVSVKAISYYPSVLRMMASKPDWTTALGQAYVDQPDDVFGSIQRLRAKARSLGYLSSNSRQRVYIENGEIRIVPAQAQYVYVPEYNPDVVYVRRYNSSYSNALTFGIGFLIGSWLNRDVDWGHHRVFYHGWRGKGWINQSRSHVHMNNNHYVNNSFFNRPVEGDRRVRNRDIQGYRDRVRRDRGIFTPPSDQNRRPDRGKSQNNSGRTGTNRNNNRFGGNRNPIPPSDQLNKDTQQRPTRPKVKPSSPSTGRDRNRNTVDKNPNQPNTDSTPKPNSGGRVRQKPSEPSQDTGQTKRGIFGRKNSDQGKKSDKNVTPDKSKSQKSESNVQPNDNASPSDSGTVRGKRGKGNR